MAQPTNRQEFEEWCMIALGCPVIEVNVAPIQVEQRVDEAISFYRDYHYDGSFESFFVWEVTEQDESNGYLMVPENIVGIVRLFDTSPTSFNFGDSDFSVESQLAQGILLGSGNITSNLSGYRQTMSDLSLFRDTFRPQPSMNFNRHTNQLYVTHKTIKAGDRIAGQVYITLDPDVYNEIWKDRWLQNYATAKIKYTWGQNMGKFMGLQTVGGVEIDASRLISEAADEIAKMEENMILNYSKPLQFYMG